MLRGELGAGGRSEGGSRRGSRRGSPYSYWTTTRCCCHATSHGCEEGGHRGHGEGKQQGVQGMPAFFIYLFYLLMPYYSSSTPEHEKRAHQRIFRVPQLPLPIISTLPLQPLSWLSAPTGHGKHTMSRVFCVLQVPRAICHAGALPCPSPCSPTQKHARVGTFSCLAASPPPGHGEHATSCVFYVLEGGMLSLLPFSLQPNTEMCPHGHVFMLGCLPPSRTRKTHNVTCSPCPEGGCSPSCPFPCSQTQECAHMDTFSCLAASPPLLSPPGHGKHTMCHMVFSFSGSLAPSSPTQRLCPHMGTIFILEDLTA